MPELIYKITIFYLYINFPSKTGTAHLLDEIDSKLFYKLLLFLNHKRKKAQT